MLLDLLNLRDVVVTRKVETPDGMGGTTVTTSTATLPRAAIWSPGQSQRYISDKMAQASTHILVTLPSYHTFTSQDREVTYGGITYSITGPSDNVMLKDEICLVGLERIV